ncbi:hypothetical protein [Jannaschia formosa]|uniref:hypothetical protein n=1 Tax=Jannaschia formosa TaxID=2259592 RepID=UPI000E1B5E9A|nr:hypothetical protein [Jannaschia formosa]TFL16081.1 hypothetical protein DR046_21900 [Jannaschia formosa]
MTDVIPIIRPARGPSPHSSCPCPFFGAAVQELERLLFADAAAQGIPDGDPAYADGSSAADAAFEAAVAAVERCCVAADPDAYRAAADVILRLLHAERAADVAFIVRTFRTVAFDRAVEADRTVSLSLRRASSILTDLAAVWQNEDLDPGRFEPETPARRVDRPCRDLLLDERSDDDCLGITIPS